MPEPLTEAATNPNPTPARSPPGATAPPESGADLRLLELADQCVMCGLCLPHCPTYGVAGVESESPRGRIAIARALTEGRIDAGGSARRHLDQCLACLSCQKVCPSGVRYDEIIVRTRAELRRIEPDRSRAVDLDAARLVRRARLGARLHADRWLPTLARILPLPSRLKALAERVPAAPRVKTRTSVRVQTPARGRVVLFRGCVASVYDRDTHAAAVRVLEALGYEVSIPLGTPCCGALARHAGDIKGAAREAAAARAAIDAAGDGVVLVSASGCFDDVARRVAEGRTRDIVDFIARDERVDTLRFRSLDARAALHLPCTQVNVVGGVASIRALLARIPGIALVELPQQPRCCGAAGRYFIDHPDIADRLRDEKLDQAAPLAPDLILTTNIGCRIHLANGLRARTSTIPVRHPLALLAEQLENDPP